MRVSLKSFQTRCTNFQEVTLFTSEQSHFKGNNHETIKITNFKFRNYIKNVLMYRCTDMENCTEEWGTRTFQYKKSKKTVLYAINYDK